MNDKTRPSIDHTILSPSGRCSKRARDAAMKRMKDLLFPEGLLQSLSQPMVDRAKEKKREGLLRRAAELRELADRGMNARKFRKEASKLEEQAKEWLEWDGQPRRRT